MLSLEVSLVIITITNKNNQIFFYFSDHKDFSVLFLHNTCRITAFSIMTLSVTTLSITINNFHTQLNIILSVFMLSVPIYTHYAECHYSECHSAERRDAICPRL
jgi:hypothetical protein